MKLRIINDGTTQPRVIDEDTGEMIEDVMNISIELGCYGNYAKITIANPKIDIISEGRIEDTC